MSPGHLAAVATDRNGREAVVWRWYDAVVLRSDDDGGVRLWEPAHGEIVAVPRPSFTGQIPGQRSYVSAGLPGAPWWVAGSTTVDAAVELEAVDQLYTENDLWPTVFDNEAPLD